MDKAQYNKAIFLERLDAKMRERNVSDRALSLRAGMSADYVRSLRRKTGSATIESIGKLANQLKCSVAWLSGESNVDDAAANESAVRPERVQLVGEVRASTFRTAFEIPESEQITLWLPPDTRYPGVPRFALKVSGPSLNEIAPDGATILCASFFDLERRAGRQPRHGDIVVVQAWRHDLVEATCKAYVERHDGVWLEPRTTANGIEPIHVRDAAGKPLVNVDEVVIHALVLTVQRDL